MYNFVAIKVKCPACGVSLMDNEKLIDNEPNIRLNIEIANKKGIIRLSSIYGSFNYDVDIELPDKEIARFSCPHCNAEIISSEECNSCQAPMIPLILDMGGRVTICSRKGCHNHLIGFEDLSVALQKLHQEYEIRGKHPHKDFIAKNVIENKTDAEEHQEILESGTFLHAYCHHCKKSLIEDEQLYLKLIKENGETGFIMLSPYLNVFTSKSTLYNPEQSIAGDICCPHCNKSIISKEINCSVCNSQVAKISVGARTKLIDFYICSKKGCRWHGLSQQDEQDIRLEDSNEW